MHVKEPIPTHETHTPIYVGATPTRRANRPTTGDFITLLGETYYGIRHVDQIPTFFMSVVSSSDHWLFIASNGGLTAGRRNSDAALFPYETEDKIAAHSDYTGSTSIIQVTREGRTQLWEPFSRRYDGLYRCERHLYKNEYGNKILFEEVNHDLQLTLRYAWRTGDRFGFIRSCWLRNDGDQASEISLVDGVQNVLPFGVTTALQTTMSSLLNAYKHTELEPQTGLGIFALSATLTDAAEPSESLKATVAWHIGLPERSHLLSSRQLDAFRHGAKLTPEHDVPGRAGAYLVHATLALPAGETQRWHTVLDVNQDSADVVQLTHLLGHDETAIEAQLESDIDHGTAELIRFVAEADGLQLSAEKTTTAHHFANVLFNIMRGGIFANGYMVGRADLLDFIRTRNRAVLAAHADWFADLPERLSIRDLYARASAVGSANLNRLCYEYLPLTFSRRHGDPSRPWNLFSINLKHPDGSPRLDYQGNWRDIFQNWEPLALAFPDYTVGIIAKFLNATTVDGFNPYRMTRDGIEWEVPEPENPWSNIGYWSDHQIIYLQKLLEITEQVQPGALRALWNHAIFSYANVPYRLRSYQEMLADWSNTIDFDWESDEKTAAAVRKIGTDGRLLRDQAGHVVHATLTEKRLLLLLAKVTNLVPDGGIWMNTQRPEWNDANNALVGKGLSVVTVAYLHRFVAFWQAQLADAADATFAVNASIATLLAEVQAILTAFQPRLESGFDDRARRAIMDELGAMATAYRTAVYAQGLPGDPITIQGRTLRDFLALVQAYIEQTLRANRRVDGLYHAYNILNLRDRGAAITHLYTMLEGQVAILSSGLLSADEALTLLQALPHSDLYRADQHTYLLYPQRRLPGFLEKNNVPAARVADSALVAALTAAGDRRLLVRDVDGVYHFHGTFRNANDAARVLDELGADPAYSELVAAERAAILDLFEETFTHAAFTGRSGTFYAYEGLGSVYWHMVSKLLLAAQESHTAAVDAGAPLATTAALAEAYYDIRQGLGFNKTPADYGAFPTDPYSHTPAGAGARQPGMTGLVKEEILTRLGELGVSIQEGCLHFAPSLLRSAEFLEAPGAFTCIDIQGRNQTVPLPAGALAFTVCQTPVVYVRGADAHIVVLYSDGREVHVDGVRLGEEDSRHIFDRDGVVQRLHVTVTI